MRAGVDEVALERILSCQRRVRNITLGSVFDAGIRETLLEDVSVQRVKAIIIESLMTMLSESHELSVCHLGAFRPLVARSVARSVACRGDLLRS